MGQKRKKEQKLIANRIKQRKFAAKYGLPKPVRSEPQSNVEQTDAPQVNTEPEKLAPYTIAETALNINGNENVKTHLVSIPDFYARRDERVIDTGVEAHVRSELFKIFSKYNIPLLNRNQIVRDVTPALASIPFNNEKNANMHSIVAHAFENSYLAINEINLSQKDKILAAQKIADVVLKNYSPIAFVNGELDSYADNYVVNNRALLKEQLERLNVENTDAAINDVEAALADAPENEQPVVENVPADNLNANNEQENAVDIPKQESPKEEPPKQEPPTQELGNTAQKLGSDKIAIERSTFEKIYIPDFDDKFEARTDAEAVRMQVKSELTDIIKAAGVEEAEKAETIAARSYSSLLDNLRIAYIRDGIRPEMREIAEECFEKAKLSIHNDGFSMKNRIITAQKLADVMLRNYSPIAFTNHQLDHYAEGYVVNDDELLKDQLRFENVPEDQIESIKQELRVGLVNGLEKDERFEQFEQVNEPDDNVNENVEPQPLHIPNFNRWLNDQIANDGVDRQVTSELKNIIREAGVTDQEIATHLFEMIHDYLPKTIPLNSHVISGEYPSMPDIAETFFADSYSAIASAELNTRDRVITAQKIADLMLKNYSPVAFKELQLDQYADNYVVNNRDLLAFRLEVKGVDKDKIEPLIQEVQNALANPPENERPDQLLDQDQNADNVQEENVVVAPPQVQIQQEPPKQEPAPKPNLVSQQDPAKLGPEWINMPEFDQKLERLNKIVALPGNTKKQISDILRESGVETGGADDPLEFKEIIKDAYDPKKLPRDVPQSMRDITKNVFISTYDALSKKGFTPKNKIETTQRITDVFLKLYSPASLSGIRELDKYTQNYVTGDKDLLRECLTTLNVPENEIKAIVGDNKEKKTENTDQKGQEKKNNTKGKQKKDNKPKEETKPVSSEARVAVYDEKLKAYNNMYKLDIDSNNFASSVIEAWQLMTSGDNQKMAEGQKVMNTLFKDTLKKAFDIEKDVAYDEHRLPEYTDIIKSTNELMRAAMYGFTDMYHDPSRKGLFSATAFGGLNAKDMGDLTVGDSLWSKDQKSNEAWDIQSREARNIADKWLTEDKPYEKMISEMKALVAANNDSIVSRKEALDKLTAVEWLLVNDEKMMIEDPEDPYNSIPNWGNRYWKALAETRAALGIDKHTAMRDLIQGDYAAMSRAVGSATYNKTQIQLYVLDKDVRELSDSMEFQKEQFATMSSAIVINEPQKEKIETDPENKTRWPISVSSQDEKLKMKNEPKVFDNIVDPENVKAKIEKDNNTKKA